MICGFGRTGEWFRLAVLQLPPGHHDHRQGPDQWLHPAGCLMFNDRIAKVLAERAGGVDHGYTHSGHPVCRAVALENIRILQEEHIIDTCKADTGPYLQQRWMELGAHPLVGEARIAGHGRRANWYRTSPNARILPNAARSAAATSRHRLAKNGLILRATNDTMLLSPPLIISRAQVDELVEKAWKSLLTCADEGVRLSG